MSRRMDVLGSMRKVIGGILGMLGYLFRFAWLMLLPKAVLAARLLAAESQLVACVDAVIRGMKIGMNPPRGIEDEKRAGK